VKGERKRREMGGEKRGERERREERRGPVKSLKPRNRKVGSTPLGVELNVFGVVTCAYLSEQHIQGAFAIELGAFRIAWSDMFGVRH